jgi:hypothetical protein
MANTFANTQLVTYESLDLLQPNLVFGGSINNDYSKEFGQEGRKVGSSISIRLPQQFIGRYGTAVNIENIADRTIPLTLTTQFGVDFEVTSADLKLNVDDVRNRYIKKAMVRIANQIDRDCFTLAALTCPNIVGTPGTRFSSEDVVRDATVKLDENDSPMDDQRYIIVNSRMEQDITKATKLQFNDQGELGKQYKRGRMGTALGYNWAMSQVTPRLVSGTLAGTPIVSGGSQTGASLLVSGFPAGATINAGDNFTIAGVFLTETVSYISTGDLQQFKVTANATANGSGVVTLSIYPAITPTGQVQNVSNAPANGAALVFAAPPSTTYSTGIAYHRDAFTLAFARLDEPAGVESATTTTDPETGVSIRCVYFWNGMTDQWIYRFDCLYGVGALYPQTACLLAAS